MSTIVICICISILPTIIHALLRYLYVCILRRTAVSLSSVVLNSRDQPENIWLPKRMCLDKQLYKTRVLKTHLNAITTALTVL